MLYLPVFILFALAVLDMLRRFDTLTTVKKHQYALYELRDDLREAAIRGDIDPGHWVFRYLDSSITKTIDRLETMTLWRAIIIALAHSGDPGLIESSRRLRSELARDGNAMMAQFHERYVSALVAFFIARHGSFRILTSNIAMALRVGEYFRVKWNRAIAYQTVAPETSTLHQFA